MNEGARLVTSKKVMGEGKLGKKETEFMQGK